MTKIIKDIRVYKGVELNTAIILLSVKLSSRPRWVNRQNLKRQGNTLL